MEDERKGTAAQVTAAGAHYVPSIPSRTVPQKRCVWAMSKVVPRLGNRREHAKRGGAHGHVIARFVFQNTSIPLNMPLSFSVTVFQHVSA
jgi:hypothetical protein